MSSIAIDSGSFFQATEAVKPQPIPRGSIYTQMGQALQSMGYSTTQIRDLQIKLQTALDGAATSVANGADRAAAFRGAMDGVLTQAGVNLDAFRNAMDPETATRSASIPLSGEVDSATITAANDQSQPVRPPTPFEKNVGDALSKLGKSADEIAAMQRQIQSALVEAGRAVANGADRATAFRNAIESVLKQNNVDPDKFRAVMARDEEQPANPTTSNTPLADADGSGSCDSSGATTSATKNDSTSTRGPSAFDKLAAAALTKLGLSADQIAQFQKGVQDALNNAAQSTMNSADDRGATYRQAIESVLQQFNITGDQFRKALASLQSHRHERVQMGSIRRNTTTTPPVLWYPSSGSSAKSNVAATQNDEAQG